MEFIAKFDACPHSKLHCKQLIKVKILYKTCIKGSTTQNVDEIEVMVMFDDVDILVNEGKKLTWYFGHV
jgi:hypothetical protein